MAALERFTGDEGLQLYKKAKFFSEEESKNDPPEEPFRSKYKARDLYKELNGIIKDKLDVSREEDAMEILCLTLCVDFLLGQIFIDTEETSEGEDYLNSIVKTMMDKNVDNCISLHINTLNNLGILASQRGNLEQCMEYFTLADKLYHDWKQNSGNDAPLSFQEYLEEFQGSEDEKAHHRNITFENTHTHTLYYLAQGYAKLEKNSLSAHYCHLTLQRQLKSGDFNPVDWGLNAATLSQYYLTSEKFPEARHCLSSGSFIFNSTLMKEEVELSEAEKEMQEQRKADINRCWVKYGLALLEASRDQMLSEVENSDLVESETQNDSKTVKHQGDHNSDVVEEGHGSASKAEKSSAKNFEEFELELTAFEEGITDKLVRIFDEARKIFLFIVDKINSAQTFYTLDTHASDGVELIQDHSKAYKLLAFFELDMKRQCCMHKRRVDMLSEILKELNPKHYLLVCRQLMFELAETFSSMVDIKIALIEMDQARVCPHTTNKINKLIHQSINKYQAYIDSLKDNKPDLPSEFPPGDVRPALVAFFCMGRLYSKFLEPEISNRLAMMKKSVDCYKFVVDYCSSNPDSKNLVPSELSICQEMVELLPLKMERLKQQSSDN